MKKRHSVKRQDTFSFEEEIIKAMPSVLSILAGVVFVIMSRSGFSALCTRYLIAGIAFMLIGAFEFALWMIQSIEYISSLE